MSFAVIATAFQVVSSLAQASMKQDAYAAESQRIAQNNANAQAEYTRQQQASADAAAQERSDRMREAEKELGLARVAAAEGAGTISMAAYKDLAYTAGLDLSRINSNLKGRVDSIQASKTAAAQSASDQIASNARASEAAGMGGVLGAVGAGANYLAKDEARTKAENAAKNKTSITGGLDFLSIG
jgi:hypothetical protein